MSLLSVAAQDENFLPDLWVRIKEIGSWAAQHPALMGLTFVGAGLLVKTTHTSRKMLRPGIQLTNPPPDINPDNPRFADWFVAIDFEGLDIPVWVVSMAAVQRAERTVTDLSSTLAVSGALTGLLNWILPTIGSVPIAVIPSALLNPTTRNQYPDQSVFEISFRTSIIGSLIWPEPSAQKTLVAAQTVTAKDAPSNSVVLLRLGDVLLMAGMAMMFGSILPSLGNLIPKA